MVAGCFGEEEARGQAQLGLRKDTVEGWWGWGEVKRVDSSSFQPNCHLASVDSMSLAGLGWLGCLGFRDFQAEARCLAVGSLMSFVYRRRGQGWGRGCSWYWLAGLQLVPAGTPA